MKILHLVATPFWSGPMENIALLAKEQRAMGDDVSIVIDRLRRPETSEELAMDRLRTWELLDLEEPSLALSVKSSPWQMCTDGYNLRKRKVDVVHTHFSHDHWLARCFVDSKITVIRSIHSPRSLGRILPAAHGYTVASKSWMLQLKNKPTLVFPALVDASFVPLADRAETRKRLGLPNSPLVGMVSTFQSSRRHSLGISAFALLAKQNSEVHFLLVGDGETRNATLSQVEQLGLQDKVHWVGYQNRENFVQYLQALDEVWVLGLGNDHSARVASQARACGVEVLAVDEGALGEYASTVVTLSAGNIADRSLRSKPSLFASQSRREVAERMSEFYRRVRPS